MSQTVAVIGRFATHAFYPHLYMKLDVYQMHCARFNHFFAVCNCLSLHR